MPIPKPETPASLISGGVPAKKLVTVVKPYKNDIPDILGQAVALAEAKRKSDPTP